jgi:hypothetical protein
MAAVKKKISTTGTMSAFFFGERACSGALFHVLNRAFDGPLKIEERAAMPFTGGIMQHGYQCGMIWGAALAAGAEAYRRLGPCTEAETKAVHAAQRLIESFLAQNNHTNCLEITEINKSTTAMKMVEYFLLKGGAVSCCRMAVKYAPFAFKEIDEVLSAEPIEVQVGPVSCAAVLAQKMGASKMHAVMAAGLAGGIGLGGGACGALGAAIWLMSVKDLNEGAKKVDFKNQRARDLIERFLKCTDYEFECTDIVGRKFESVKDHACHMQGGGCSKIIEVLAEG